MFFRHRRYREYRAGFASGRVSRADVRRLSALGLPVALQLGMESAAFSLSAIFVGWLGTTALAAHQVMLTVSSVLYMINSGMAAAVAVRASYFAGQGDYEAVRRTAASGLHVVLAIAFTLSVPIFLLRGEMSWWFTDSAEVCSLVSVTVFPLIAYQFGDGLQYTFANALRGIECVRPMVWIAFFSYFVVSLPLGWLLGIHMGYGLVGIWSAFPVCLSLAGLLYYLRFKRELKSLPNPPSGGLGGGFTFSLSPHHFVHRAVAVFQLRVGLLVRVDAYLHHRRHAVAVHRLPRGQSEAVRVARLYEVDVVALEDG